MAELNLTLKLDMQTIIAELGEDVVVILKRGKNYFTAKVLSARKVGPGMALPYCPNVL
jgi:hypothetical protein